MNDQQVKHHLAIMKREWGMVEKIFSGQKTIESRWYNRQCQPWKEIKTGDLVFFKETGSPVTLKSKVRKVLRFTDLTPEKVRWILSIYGSRDGIKGKEEQEKYFAIFKQKRYCLLIFLEKVQKIKPFPINKKGYGWMAGWIVVDNINKLKIRRNQYE